MSGGTPFQYAVLLTVIGLAAAAVVLRVVVGRVRRAWATGSVEANSVRSKAQAREITDRLFDYCTGRLSNGGGAPPRIRVRGAARLMQALSADDRFDVRPRDGDDEYWSFVVLAPDGGPADDGPADRDGLGRDLADILSRNGVTARV